MTAASKQETLASLETKVHAYCEVSPEGKTMHGLSEYATQLRQDADLKTLRAVAREVDTWLRETHTAEQQLAISAHLLARGVLEIHLPPSVDRLVQNLIRRGSISSQAEAVLVKEILVNSSLVAKYAGEVQALQAMLDPWDIKA